MASRHIGPTDLAAMDWRDVGAILNSLDKATETQPAATLTEDEAAAFRAELAAHAGATADG